SSHSNPSSSNDPISPGERRAAARQRIRPDNCYVLLAAVGDKLYPARIQDVSTQGVALVVSRRYEPGTLLTVDVTDTNGRFSRTLLVQVTRVVNQSDGSCLIAGAFMSRLTPSDLTAWLT